MRWTALLITILATRAMAGEADVLAVKVSCDDQRSCHFSVTVRHDDAGWDHYADRWEVLSPAGEILAVRELAHPHDDEQPFTRSLRDVEIAEGIAEVVIRARDSQHGFGGREFTAELPLSD